MDRGGSMSLSGFGRGDEQRTGPDLVTIELLGPQVNRTGRRRESQCQLAGHGGRERRGIGDPLEVQREVEPAHGDVTLPLADQLRAGELYGRAEILLEHRGVDCEPRLRKVAEGEHDPDVGPVGPGCQLIASPSV